MDRLYVVLVRWQDRVIPALRRLRLRLRCWRGHTNLLVIEPPDIYLACSECGKRTCGWGHRPVPVARGAR